MTEITFEKVVALIFTATLLWVGTTLTSVNTRLFVLETKVDIKLSSHEKAIEDLKKRMTTVENKLK